MLNNLADTVSRATLASASARPIQRYRVLRVVTTVAGARAESVCDCRGFEHFGAVSQIAANQTSWLGKRGIGRVGLDWCHPVVPHTSLHRR